MNNEILRIDTTERLSMVTVFNGVAHVAGIASHDHDNIEDQTRAVLSKIDELLEKSGTDKSKLLTAQILMREVDRDFHGMNNEWLKWVIPHQGPARATYQVKLPGDKILVEILVTAAI